MGSEQQIVVDAAEPHRLLLTVDDFITLHEAGAFEHVGRVELIEGEIYKMAALHRPHARATIILSGAIDAAVEALGVGLETLGEPSTRLDENNLPQADIVIADAVDERIVSGGTVRVLVEVAASSIGHDLGVKKRLYARTGVPEYWVADVDRRAIIRFHKPAGDDYAERAEFTFGEPVPSATIPDLIVDTSRLA